MICFFQEENNPDGPVKIGKANDPQKRLRQIQNFSLLHLRILPNVRIWRGKVVLGGEKME